MLIKITIPTKAPKQSSESQLRYLHIKQPFANLTGQRCHWTSACPGLGKEKDANEPSNEAYERDVVLHSDVTGSIDSDGAQR